ncbi:MAG: hypothetical protein M0Z43_06015 [Acidithiobacillus sp.]|nr:hypothetical protein [Acidithiobacillus sp.]
MLGKAPAKRDERTLRLTAIMAGPEVPESYDFDAGKNIPTPMFANDVYGDCVIAGRAHMTLRLEYTEQGRIIGLHDGDVIREYDHESGGVDGGLVMIESLNAWRRGWKAAGGHYNIHAYAAMNPQEVNEVKAAIALLSGAYVGLALPLSAQEEISGGQPWTDTSDDPGSWGGHCVYIPAYDPDGLTCVTWGRKQRMTWEFFAAYCDEAFAVCDDRDRWLASSPVDVGALDRLLTEVTQS